MDQSSENSIQKLDDLIQKARAGDEIAFGLVYDLYFEKVYRFVFYRVNHRQTAEDLVAEVFTKAWNKLSEIQNPSLFNAWIYQIARNLVIDFYRSRKFEVDIQTLENVLEYDENIIDRTNLQFQQKIVLAALKKLSPDQQVVIKLKFLDELDNFEIAKILNKTEGAIRVIQHRAIIELKNILNNQRTDEG